VRNAKSSVALADYSMSYTKPAHQTATAAAAQGCSDVNPDYLVLIMLGDGRGFAGLSLARSRKEPCRCR
jgi:hypothetical protein